MACRRDGKVETPHLGGAGRPKVQGPETKDRVTWWRLRSGRPIPGRARSARVLDGRAGGGARRDVPRVGEREGEPERRAAARLGAERETAAHGLHQAPRDIQPRPGAAAVDSRGAARILEGSEDARRLGR